MNASDKVYKMLGFQYKPIEAKLKELNPNLYKKYLKLNPAARIAFCDRIAGQLGL